MGELTFKKKMPRSEALKLAKKKNDWLWNIIYFRHELSRLELMYVEYKIVKVRTEREPSIFEKRKGISRRVVKTFEILFNGTSGKVSLIAEMPEIVEMDFDEGQRVQRTTFYKSDIDINVKKLAHKLTHRNLGGNHKVEIVETTSVFRPFYAAFYGEYAEGNKVRYIMIPADYGTNTRAR